MNMAIGFWSLLALLIYGIIIVLGVLGIYALILAIKALKIYIQKNS